MKKTALETFDHNALLYQQKYMDLDMYDDTYDAFLAGLQTSARLLELGCGPGNITRYLLEKRPDLQILATDFSPKMIELAKSNVPDADFRQTDAKEILALNERFDGIVCGFIAPYLDRTELSKLISDCEKMLTENGKLYLSTIDGQHEHSDWQNSSDGASSTMVFLYSEPDIRSMLYQNGFRSIEVFRKAFGNSTHLIFLAAF